MKSKLLVFMFFCSAALILVVVAGCERADSKTQIKSPEQQKALLKEKINIIAKKYLASLQISKLKNKQVYNENLINSAREIARHGKPAAQLLLHRIGENPKEDLLLVEAYFQIVGETQKELRKAVHSKNSVLSHHATFRYEMREDSGYIWGEKYLAVLLSALDDKSIFACKRNSEGKDALGMIGKPVWAVAATKIKARLGLDLGITEQAEKAPNFTQRIELLKSWLKATIPYLYSRQYLQPSALHEYKTYHLDEEAMNASIPTKKFRKMKEHRWTAPDPTGGGYGSPFYEPDCFANWKLYRQSFSTYDQQRYSLSIFETPLEN